MIFSPHKTRVAVLRGGPSHEYEHSLVTGKHIINNLSDDFHSLDIFVDKESVWYEGGIRVEPQQILNTVDLVWNALHGFGGEEGKIHGILDDFGVPYIGSPKISSSIAFNKAIAKNILEKHGIKTPFFNVLDKKNSIQNIVSNLHKNMPFPMVIKPVSSGSSFGFSVVYRPEDLESAIRKAFLYAEKIIVEEYINGSVLSSGVIEDFRGASHYPLLPIVLSGTPVNEDVSKQIGEIAVLVHKTLGLKDYSQSDFVVHPKRGIFFLEVNTIPKLHEDSKFVSSLKSIGSNIREFVSHMLSRAIKRTK